MSEITGQFPPEPGEKAAGRTVRARLVGVARTPIAGTVDDVAVEDVTATTDNTGAVTLDLTPNASIDQQNTLWRVGVVGDTTRYRYLDVTGVGTLDEVDDDIPDRRRPWLPDIVTLQAPGGYTLTQPDHAVPAAESGLWGGPSDGWWRDTGDEVQWSFRCIYGTQVDEDWDPGSGYLGITLPRPPHQSAKSVSESAWLFGISADFGTIAKASGEFFVDPPISTDPVAVFSPDGITSWATVDPEAVPPPGYALMPDYPVPSTGAVFVVGGSGHYRKAPT